MPLPDAKIICKDDQLFMIELNGQQIPAGTYPAIHRTVAATKDFKRVIPKLLVVVVHINGHPVWALIDSGSLSELVKPIIVQLVVQGSRSN